MNNGKKIRRVSVLQVQRLPAEKVVELIEDFNDGKLILVSLYRSRMAHIHMESDTLDKFVRDIQGIRYGALNFLMKKLARRWQIEDTEGIHSPEERVDKEIVSSIAPPGFHSAKVL